MLKTFVSGKIHGIRVTHKSVEYHGSISIAWHLMKDAGISEYEQVHVINLNNGERWVTYAIPADSGVVLSLNGGGARRGEMGDRCVILTYAQAEKFQPAPVVHLDENNEVKSRFNYEVLDSTIDWP